MKSTKSFIIAIGLLCATNVSAHYEDSPYVYCAGDPVNAIDPDGRSTWVISTGNGLYQVIGGDLKDNDRNVYVYAKDKESIYKVRGKSIGQTTSTTSFYNSDKNTWAKNSSINLNDISGENFLNKMASSNVTLDDYLKNARTYNTYDFKVTNGTKKIISKSTIYIYRGMPIGKTYNGQPLISSGRDIGNIAAGLVAAKNGISWGAARIAFDAYQSKSNRNFVTEGISTRNAEYYGWSMMYKYSDTNSELGNLWNSVVSFFDSIF